MEKRILLQHRFLWVIVDSSQNTRNFATETSLANLRRISDIDHAPRKFVANPLQICEEHFPSQIACFLVVAIHIMSQFMYAPKNAHWNVVLRMVRYLKNSPGQGVLLRANTPQILTAWCDSDHGSCPLTHRSLSGWFIQFGDSPLSWKTKKQDVVSRSSAEAEYRTMADSVSELLWLRELLPILGIEVTAPITLHSDSLSAIMLAANPVFHARTKHVGRDVHFVRDEIIRGVIATKHVSTTSQLADIMTKALGRKEFENFLVKLGVCILHTPP
ncbi:hypothetical protein ISN44_As13g008040 [Arabidopsis suecica]|uniref:Uncharacterized protein n=1 Tax=Arabidopsis suecica TaxID=45249 RepID=A0A8T1XY94_ARASU|nr:hypothetical protein ISN44_As13g008020 [Arabidopsis suecica]KAG7536883.1 hypothetical protein ISN44_As13g008040 [Arabidopsis suecica]